MIKNIIFIFCLFLFPVFFGTVHATEFQGNNILDYIKSVQVSGDNSIIANNTGIYISGDGIIHLQLNNYDNNSLHFNTNFDGDDTVFVDPYYNLFDDFDLFVDGTFSYFTDCPQTGYGSGPVNAPYRIHTCYDPHGNVFLTHTIISIAQSYYSTTLQSSLGFPTNEIQQNEFTLHDISYDIFTSITTTSDNPVHLRAEIYKPEPSKISSFNGTVLSDRVNLEWSCPVYDGLGYNNECSNISNYKILRNNSLLAEVSDTTYTDTNFSFDADYDYSIITINNLGVESELNTISISTLPEIHSPELQLSHNGDSITISWSDPYLDVTQFKVKRSDGKVWDVPSTQKTIHDNDGIVLSETYSYQIQSRTASIINDWSDVYSISYPSIRSIEVSYRTIFDVLYLTPTITTNENGHGTITKFSVRFNPDESWHDVIYSGIIGNLDVIEYPEMEFTINDTVIENLESVTILADFDTGDDPQQTIPVSNITIPTYQPDLTGDGTTAIDSSFADENFALYLKKDLESYDVSCQYSDLNGNTSWHNGTVTTYYSLNVNTDSYKTYVDCWNGDGTQILSSVFDSGSQLYGFDSLNNLSDSFGDFAGVSIPLLFVIFVGAIFTAKNAHMGVLVLGGTIGIMGVLGFLTVEPLMWGLIVLLIILGLFAGKKS